MGSLCNDDAEVTQLLPCPFCGSEDVSFDRISESVFDITCWKCHSGQSITCGPEAPTRAEAIAAWNTRQQAIAQHDSAKETHPKLYKALRDRAKMLQQAIARHEGGRGEPVALLQEHPSGDRELELYRNGSGCLTDADKAAGWSETPLYAHPPATCPAALAEDEVEGLVEELVFLADSRQQMGWDRAGDAMEKAANRITQQAEEVARLREVLTASGDTKAAYMGEFAFNLTRIDECGDEYAEKIFVPWTTIKEIMAAIRARAALNEQLGGEG